MTLHDAVHRLAQIVRDHHGASIFYESRDLVFQLVAKWCWTLVQPVDDDVHSGRRYICGFYHGPQIFEILRMRLNLCTLAVKLLGNGLQESMTG